MRYLKKSALLTTMALTLIVSAAMLHAETKANTPQDGPVAKVNGATISRTEFDRSIVAATRQFASVGAQTNSADGSSVNIEKEVLDRLIDIQLLLQDADKRSLAVEDSTANEVFESFKKQFPDEAQFNTFLTTNNTTEAEMRVQAKNQLTIKKLEEVLQQELMASIEIPEEEVKNFYTTNIDKFKRPEQVKASHILINVDQQADEKSKAEAHQKIEDIRKKAQAGDDFAELARNNSQCPSSAQGGDLGFFGKGQMVKAFEDAAFSLKPGEMSTIVETQFGYHLIKLNEKRDAGAVDFEEVKERISLYLTQLEMDAAHQQYIKGLRDKAEITRLID